MSLPIAYRNARIVNPEWIHAWKLAHSNDCRGVFTASFITPEPYITINLIVSNV